MISNKHFNKLVSILVAIAVSFSLILIVLTKSSTSTTYIEQPNYVTTIFEEIIIYENSVKMEKRLSKLHKK